MPQRLEPLSPDMKEISDAQSEAAINLIRQKLARVLGEEPDAVTAIADAHADTTPSKHQLYMRELSNSGKSLAEIQTEWHRYYTMLPDVEKSQVWEEFYSANQNTPYQKMFAKGEPAPKTTEFTPPQVSTYEPIQSPAGVVVTNFEVAAPVKTPPAVQQKPKLSYNGKGKVNTKGIKQRIRNTIDGGGKLTLKQQFQSLFFGLGMGAIVLAILLLGFFNEMVIAPFIQPSRQVTDAPVIMSSATADAANPTVIIPKINIQIPVDFAVASADEDTFQEALNGGVVHYPSTSKPGQNGNAAYFGHSSQNMFNNGKYKYAFVLLHRLTTGDVFWITHEGKSYAYQVFAREVVAPTQVSVLHDTKGKTATAALITCDPPGFSTNRLVVWGEQISPSIASNTAPDPIDPNIVPTELADKGESAFSRFLKVIQFWKDD